ncbi:MAG: hypothetical protein AAF927_10180 [Bacteroidota bacterium]
MSYTLLTYLIYLGLAFVLTFLVGRSLFRNGRPFLVDIFKGDSKLADSINRLLLTGFYLLNVGYVSLSMYSSQNIRTVEHMVEKLSYKLGLLFVILGVVHIINLIVLYKTRKRNSDREPKAQSLKLEI